MGLTELMSCSLSRRRAAIARYREPSALLPPRNATVLTACWTYRTMPLRSSVTRDKVNRGMLVPHYYMLSAVRRMLPLTAPVPC